MKKLYFIAGVFLMVLFGSCNWGHHDISISTSDSPRHLNFSANYPAYKTKTAQAYIEDFLKEKRIFNAASDNRKAEIWLTDGTKFYLSYEPGAIEINFSKVNNSPASYQRIKQLCEGFGNALKD